MTKATPKASIVKAPAATASVAKRGGLDDRGQRLVTPRPGEKTNAALEAAADQLAARGIRENDIEKILAPVWEAVKEEFGV